jgi:hypothetical protein
VTASGGVVTVIDNRLGSPDGTDTLTGVEMLRFVEIDPIVGAQNVYYLVDSGSSGAPIDLGSGFSPLYSLTGANDFVLGTPLSLNNRSIDLGAGTGDTVILGLAGGYTLNPVNVENLVGSGGNDTVTLSNTSGLSVDLGAGSNDIVNLQNGPNSLTVINVETVFGSSNNDTIVIANAAGATTTTVTGGLGADTITASVVQDNFRFTSVADSPSGGASDVINNFDAFGDKFTFSGMTIANSSINFIEVGGFAGSGQASALLAGNILQIDVNGDGAMGIGDMEINLANLNGTLHSNNFLIT